MTIEDQDIRALAFLAKRRRPYGAPRWDEQGIVAALEKVRHLQLCEVMDAIGKAADDRAARSPAVITNVRSQYWRPDDPDRPRPREPYDAHGVCSVCGMAEGACRSRWRDHDYLSVAAARARGAGPDPERLAGIKVETACEDRPAARTQEDA